MYKKLCFAIAAVFALAVVSGSVHAQVVSFDVEELALDGSNLDVSGAQVLAANPSGDDVFAAGIDWDQNTANIAFSAVGGIGDRNNQVGGVPAPYDATTVGGNSETFLGLVGIDAYHDPSGTLVETDLHDALESIFFNASFTFTLSNLIPGNDYRLQVVSWDAGVEGEGDGTELTTKEYRESTISATTAGASGTLDYNQFVVDGVTDNGTPVDGLFGNSSDEITAALITGTFTAVGTDLEFTMAARANNDNAVLTGLVLHNLTIPEPTSALLACAGLVSLGLVRRRK